MADSERLALADRLDTEHQHRSPWGTLGCTCPVCPDLRAAAGALREGVRRRTATFENTERDRLAWRDRAWKAESERDAALAEVERLIADGQQDVPVVDDETREDVLDAVRHAKDTLTEVAVRYPSWGSELRLAGRTLDALAAAYLGRTD